MSSLKVARSRGSARAGDRDNRRTPRLLLLVHLAAGHVSITGLAIATRKEALRGARARSTRSNVTHPPAELNDEKSCTSLRSPSPPFSFLSSPLPRPYSLPPPPNRASDVARVSSIRVHVESCHRTGDWLEEALIVRRDLSDSRQLKHANELLILRYLEAEPN